MRLRLLSSFRDAASIARPALALLILSAITTLSTLPAHTLKLHAASWTIVLIYSVIGRRGLRSDGTTDGQEKRCWSAGAAMVLGAMCERAARAGDGLWWTKALLPVLLLVFQWLRYSASSPPREAHAPGRSKSLLAIITLTSLVVLARPFVTSPAIVLGLSAVVFQAVAYICLEDALSSHEESDAHAGGLVSADGTLSPMTNHVPSDSAERLFRTTMHVSAVASVGCAVAAYSFESFRWDGFGYHPRLEQMAEWEWQRRYRQLRMAQGILMLAASGLSNVLTVLMIQTRGCLYTSFLPLAGAWGSHLLTATTILSTYFTLLSAAATHLFLTSPTHPTHAVIPSRGRMRARQLLTLVSILSFGALTVYLLRQPINRSSFPPPVNHILPISSNEPLDPLPPSSSTSHPIYHLINQAENDLEAVVSRQSLSLPDAVAEYQRRYKIPPPPNFDKWYEFAKKKGVELIDEFDTIHHSLLPFWAVEPSTIRGRTREAIGFDNALIGMSIRDGRVTLIERGQEWQQQATVGMMEGFVHLLPDMDLAFNMHDEPRVVVPYDDLIRLVTTAKERNMPTAYGNPTPRNAFSGRPRDLNDGKRMAEFKTTRFNRYAHQPTWIPSKLSCPPDSPARSLDEHASDNQTAYALGELGFIYNATAFTDICNSPSFRETLGFFDRPNAFDIVHDLFPVFSQSKISSFQDILYPSPWYWYGKVKYDEEKDRGWEKKESRMYWRGSTTGGFSRDGGWRRQHRQRVVQRINALDTAKTLHNSGGGSSSSWHVQTSPREDHKELFDVHFSHVGQCDPNDCDAQKEFFTLAPPADQQDAWGFKYLLDMDGNAFSGRFYAFLKSKSLVYKMAVFREWHNEWLRPWAHYIPLGLKGEEYVEAVRYFNDEEEGRSAAERVAVAGTAWADKVLRNADFEVWFFRLLLEYGRVIDDEREVIGYAGP
ncbi:MAG: capsule-associated protein CAP1 [Caeruleum heppii]|nr:MAG: capsule-associated protein CAP1 [Caeruleum heppii]